MCWGDRVPPVYCHRASYEVVLAGGCHCFLWPGGNIVCVGELESLLSTVTEPAMRWS